LWYVLVVVVSIQNKVMAGIEIECLLIRNNEASVTVPVDDADEKKSMTGSKQEPENQTANLLATGLLNDSTREMLKRAQIDHATLRDLVFDLERADASLREKICSTQIPALEVQQSFSREIEVKSQEIKNVRAVKREANRLRQEAQAREEERLRQAQAKEEERLRQEAQAKEEERLRQEEAKEKERLRQEAQAKEERLTHERQLNRLQKLDAVTLEVVNTILGKCPANFEWKLDPGIGYVCAGGSHKVSFADFATRQRTCTIHT